MDLDIRTDNRFEPKAQKPRSTAQIAGHPIHPMLIPFPIAFFLATLACDLVYLSSGATDLVIATQWLLGTGLLIGVLAAIAGMTDLFAGTRTRNWRAVWWHAGGNILAVLISAYNFYLRSQTGAATGLDIGEVALSALVVLVLVFSGWKGWEMVYRGRAGVAD
jgi:uncharacterized membrane protein